jgi:hypothetical protein
MAGWQNGHATIYFGAFMKKTPRKAEKRQHKRNLFLETVLRLNGLWLNDFRLLLSLLSD